MVTTVPAVSPAAAQIPEARWDLIQNGPQPDRALHVMVFDPFSDSLWVFGGVEADPGGSDFDNSVWRFDLSDPDPRWTLQPISGLRPPPVIFHSAVFDPERRRMIVYGGQMESEQLMDGNSVWFLELSDPDNPSWTRESVAGIPGDRFAHAAVYVPTADAMVVSGGVDASNRFLNTNHALMLGETPMRWERLSNVGFQPRAAQALIFDGQRERLLSYGGFINDESTTRNVDALDLSSGLADAERWTRLSTANAGLSRGFTAHFLDAERGLWWIHGGRLSGNAFSRRLSVLDLNPTEPRWTETSLVVNGPLERFGHTAAWDPERATAWFQGGTPDNNRTFADLRALVFERAPTATSSPTTAATPTETETTSPTASVTPSTSPTPPDETSTPSATPPEATPTPPDPTATATESAETPSPTPSPTRTLEATATATATRADLPPAPIYLPLVHRDFVTRATRQATETPVPVATGRPTTEPDPTATDAVAMTLLGHYGGEAPTLALGPEPGSSDGAIDRIYLAVGPRVEVLDAQSLALLGRSAPLPGIVQALVADGGRLYVGHREGLTVLDVTQPEGIASRSDLDVLAAGPIDDLEIRDDRLLAAGGAALSVFDRSDPDRPERIAQQRVGRTAFTLEVDGDRAFLGHRAGVTAFDISDPDVPAELGQLDLDRGAFDLKIDGDRDRLLIASDRDGLIVADTSDASGMSVSSSLAVDGRPQAIVLGADDRAYLASDFGGLVIVDLSDPDAPSQIASLATPSFDSRDLRRLGDRVYMADGSGGLQVVDASDPAAPALGAAHDVSGRMTHLSRTGELAWTVQNNKDARVIDIGDPTDPRLLTAFASARAEATIPRDDLLYMAYDFQGIAIFDISDPADPVLRSQLATGGNVLDIALDGAVLHAANLGSYVTIDVSDPDQPALLGELETPGSTTRILYDGGISYLSAGQELWIVDASDPAQPSLLTTVGLEGSVLDLALDGDRLWIAESSADLAVYDVSEPSDPQPIGRYDTSSGVYALAVDGPRIYLGSAVGVEVFDASDPAAAHPLGSLRLGGRILDIVRAGLETYLVGDGGLYAVRIELP